MFTVTVEFMNVIITIYRFQFKFLSGIKVGNKGSVSTLSDLHEQVQLEQH